MIFSLVNHPPSSHLVSCQQNSTRGRAGSVWNRRSLWWRLKQKQKVRDEEETECLFIKCLRAGHLGVEQICFQTQWICADDLGAFDERQRAGRIVKVFHVTIFTFFLSQDNNSSNTFFPSLQHQDSRSHHIYSDCFNVADCFSLSNWFIGFFFQLFIPKITETNSCWSVRSRGDGCKRATCLTEGRNIITVSSHPPCL